MGLIGMRERAALVGGTLQIESEQKAGTTIFARVPVHFSVDEAEGAE
jgi:chemotaxis family two-component system sensor kinase Cph1